MKIKHSVLPVAFWLSSVSFGLQAASSKVNLEDNLSRTAKILKSHKALTSLSDKEIVEIQINLGSVYTNSIEELDSVCKRLKEKGVDDDHQIILAFHLYITLQLSRNGRTGSKRDYCPTADVFYDENRQKLSWPWIKRGENHCLAVRYIEWPVGYGRESLFAYWAYLKNHKIEQQLGWNLK